jgi:exopolyphosphatase/guanosine-5'-triphosphate,3'-diphosphate pyrophosphatase
MRIPAVRVAVIDVGSNTVRLLVASPGRGGVDREYEEREYVGLGAEILEHGIVRPERLDVATETVRRFARAARKLRVDRLEVFVTAPGRQAGNADELVEALSRVAREPVRVLSAEEEAALAYLGAVAAVPDVEGAVAVCDVGGGSTEIAIGVPTGAPAWVRSFDLGSLRLSAAIFGGDPPTQEELEAAEAFVADELEVALPPRPATALAVGGSARAIARLVGPEFGEPELTVALRLTTGKRAAKVAKAFGIDEERARVLPAGSIILRGIARRLGVPFRLARGGIREGAVTAVAAELEAA